MKQKGKMWCLKKVVVFSSVFNRKKHCLIQTHNTQLKLTHKDLLRIYQINGNFMRILMNFEDLRWLLYVCE